jgi:hypothetical protein
VATQKVCEVPTRVMFTASKTGAVETEKSPAEIRLVRRAPLGGFVHDVVAARPLDEPQGLLAGLLRAGSRERGEDGRRATVSAA